MTTPLLIGSKTSPYSRRLRLLLHGRTYEFKAINYLENPDDAAFLKQFTPINKIPVLVDGETKIFESRVIANYLMKKYHDLKTTPWLSLSIEDENVLSMVDAANDVAVNFFLLRRGGLDLETKNWYVERQKERVPALFDQLEPWAKSRNENDPTHWNYVAMSLFSYVDWALFRNMADFSSHGGLTNFVERFSKHPGITETSPRP